MITIDSILVYIPYVFCCLFSLVFTSHHILFLHPKVYFFPHLMHKDLLMMYAIDYALLVYTDPGDELIACMDHMESWTHCGN